MLLMSGLEIALSSYIRYRFIEMGRLVTDSMKNPEIEHKSKIITIRQSGH